MAGHPLLPPDRPARSGRIIRWAAGVALTWSIGYVGLAIAWLDGGSGYPWQLAGSGNLDVSLMDTVGSRTGAWLVVAVASLGAVLSGALLVLGRRPHPSRALRGLAVASMALGAVLAVVVPDFRLLAGLGYTPILIVGWILGFTRDIAPTEAFIWPWLNLLLLSLAGLAFIASGVRAWRTAASACLRCGRRAVADGDRSSAPAAWRSRAAVAVAVAVPVGYAVTRFAWAMGIPFGVTDESFRDIREVAGFGAGLGAFAVVGAILTTGLVLPFGEVFPRWLPRLGGRRVPVALAVVPASVVSVAVTSAGLMFVRLGLTGGFEEAFPISDADVAGWLPEMFWPLWGLALATATYAYWLRRRGTCTVCGREPEHAANGERLVAGAR